MRRGGTTESWRSSSGGSQSVHPVASNILRSSGSPISLPSMMVREWQQARHCRSRSGAFWTGETGPSAGPPGTTLARRGDPGVWSDAAAMARRAGERGVPGVAGAVGSAAVPTAAAPRTSTPSSVRVPVLSKQMASRRPARFTLHGEMQKMFAFLRRSMANSIPMVMAAGSAGGTAMVTMSQALRMISRSSTLYSMNDWIDEMNPHTAIVAMTAMNLKESSLNLNVVGFGNRIERTSRPLAVVNPVRSTIACTFSRRPTGRASMALVPQKRMKRLSRSESKRSLSSEECTGTAVFRTGRLSPVSIDSFTTTEPDVMTASHGITIPSSTSMTSPGTSWEESTVSRPCARSPARRRTTRTGQENCAMSRILRRFALVERSETSAENTEITAMVVA
mmetsp:Transcript_36645/g.86768  ORF Transcript_36645/g.86768 Transcript_36645/m.86768 type:complete len:393 (-) Transcript_36645:932-2110(-)